MAVQQATLAGMGKKKPTSARQGDKGAARQPVLGLRLDPQLIAQIHVSAKRNRRTLTAEVSIALEEYLQKSGLWPVEGEPTK